MTLIALSSYWRSGRDASPLEFFAAGTDLRFDCFEVSGIHQDTFYDKVRPGVFCIVSIHDPAPPAHGTRRLDWKELGRLDVVYTSLDEGRRRQAVAITRRTIDVAADYGARAIVLHIGQSNVVTDAEKQLKQLFLQGQIKSPAAEGLRLRLNTERVWHTGDHMNALRRSLDELSAYAATRQIKLGIENRPAHEFAGFAEIGEILSWYPGSAVGYWHDTGHAQVQAKIGFTPHADWLRAYGNRLIGMHLHDAVGIDTHRAPGEGDVGWAELAPLIPTDAIRVVEADWTVSAQSLRTGVEHLKRTGWLG